MPSPTSQREICKVGGTSRVAALAARAPLTDAFRQVPTLPRAHPPPPHPPNGCGCRRVRPRRGGAIRARSPTPLVSPPRQPRPRSPPARARGAWPAPSSSAQTNLATRSAAAGGGRPREGAGPSSPTRQLSPERGLRRPSPWAGEALAVGSRAGSSRRSQACSPGAGGVPPAAAEPAGAAGTSACRAPPTLPRGRRAAPRAPPLCPQPRQRHPPRAAGAHAAAKVSAGREPGGPGSDIPEAPPALAGATALLWSSPTPRLILLPSCPDLELC